MLVSAENVSSSKPILNDHLGGIRKAGWEVANAEFGARGKTEDSAALLSVNCSEMGCLRVGG